MAVGTGKDGIGQLNGAKVLSTDHLVGGCELAVALDVCPIGSDTSRGAESENSTLQTLLVSDTSVDTVSRNGLLMVLRRTPFI
jgi:hypothetical protein